MISSTCAFMATFVYPYSIFSRFHAVLLPTVPGFKFAILSLTFGLTDSRRYPNFFSSEIDFASTCVREHVFVSIQSPELPLNGDFVVLETAVSPSLICFLLQVIQLQDLLFTTNACVPIFHVTAQSPLVLQLLLPLQVFFSSRNFFLFIV